MAADDHELDESPHQSPPPTSPTTTPPPPTTTTATASVPATATSGTGPADRGACQGAPEDLSDDSKDVVKELEEEEKQQQEEGSDGIPYDRGWGWMVALGVFVNYVLLMGYIKSSGLFYVELLERFQASASQTALLFALRHAVYGVSGFLVMNVLVSRYTAKRLVFLGGLLMALSAILSSLANQLTLLICLQAGLLAIGHTLMIAPGQVLIGRYFKKWRNLALGFTECGVSVGNLLLPLLISYFLREYALQGTLLLYGGLCLNSLPAALLHRPLSFYAKRRGKPRKEGTRSVDAPEDPNASPNEKDFQEGDLGSSSRDFGDESVPERRHSEVQQRMKETGEFESVPLTGEKRAVFKNGASDSNQETVGAEQEALLARPDCSHGPEKQDPQCCGLSQRCLFSLLNFSLFKDPLFLIFMVFSPLSSFTFLPVDYLPALVGQHGVSESQAALLLSLIGGLDLVCRVACSLLSNAKLVRVSTLILVDFFALALVMQLVRYMETFGHFVVLAVVQGLLGSVGSCLFPQLVIELVGVERMGAAVGWNQLTVMLMLPVYPLLGYLRDTTGSYAIVYHLIGLGLVISGGALCFVRPLRRYQQRRQRPGTRSGTAHVT